MSLSIDQKRGRNILRFCSKQTGKFGAGIFQPPPSSETAKDMSDGSVGTSRCANRAVRLG